MAENKDTAPRCKTLDELMQFAQERAARGREAAEQKAAETPCTFALAAWPRCLSSSSGPLQRASRAALAAPHVVAAR